MTIAEQDYRIVGLTDGAEYARGRDLGDVMLAAAERTQVRTDPSGYVVVQPGDDPEETRRQVNSDLAATSN